MTGFNPALPVQKFFDPTTGASLANGTVTTYLDGTDTPEPTYADAALTVPNPTTISLGAAGEAVMYFDDAKEYKLVTKRSNGTVARTMVDVRSPGASASASVDLLRSDLLDVTDVNKNASLMNYKQPQAGSVVSSVRKRFTKEIWSHEFGLDGGGGSETTKMQAFLNAAAEVGQGVLLPGDYFCDALVAKSKTHVVGMDRARTRILAKSSLPDNATLLINEVLSGALNTWYDEEIIFENLSFFGNNQGTSGRTNALIAFLKAKRVRLIGCRISNNGYQGVALGGCKDVLFDDVEIDACGKATVTAEGGAAIHMGAMGDGTVQQNTTFRDCYIHDCEWSGIYAHGHRTLIEGCRIHNVKEGGIFANSTAYNLKVMGGEIMGVTKKYISSSGIESGAALVNIGGGLVINDVGDCAVALTDAQHVAISGISTLNVRRDAASFPQGSHFAIITTNAAPNQPKNITIEGNTSSDATSPAYAAVAIGNSGAAVEYVKVLDNNFGGTAWTSGKAIYKQAGKFGVGSVHKNNDAVDSGAKVFEVLTPASPASTPYTSVGFKPSRIEINCVSGGGSPQRVSQGWSNGAAQNLSHYWAADGSAGISSTSGTKIINLVTPAGADQVIANLTSMDDDGFTLNYTTTAIQAYATITAYP